VRIVVEIAVRAGSTIQRVASDIRETVAEVLATETDLLVESVDVVVRDLLPPSDDEPDPDAEEERA
jgi:uncharacterized alkaline shock family protein YloU